MEWRYLEFLLIFNMEKNKVIRSEEFIVKESRCFGFNKPSLGLRKDDIECS